MSHYKSLSHFDKFHIKEAELRRKDEELSAFRAKLRKKMRTSSLTHLPTRREVRVIIAAFHVMPLCMLRCLNSTVQWSSDTCLLKYRSVRNVGSGNGTS